MTAPVVLWFRQDLRLDDNPALCAALATGQPVLAVYILDDEAPGRWRMGGASRWWLHGSLKSLEEALGGRLHLARGPAAKILAELVRGLDASAIFWNRRYEPWAIAQDRAIKEEYKRAGIQVQSFNGTLGQEPWEVLQQGQRPYKVFTPYSRAWGQRVPAPPLPHPASLDALQDPSDGEDLDSWQLRPTAPDWAGGMRETWTPGLKGADAALFRFVDELLAEYAVARDRPGLAATSRLSPHLHAGDISPRRVIQAVQHAIAADQVQPSQGQSFLRQLIWRDFAHASLFHFPDMAEQPLRPEFADFAWRDDPEGLRAWQMGRTGYPLVDAGMRQLWQTGFMENRVRMVAGSFLTKDLRLPWQTGEAWFWDTLVDADLANNAMGWQWVAGCGIDAAPYFRIFNPTTQAQTCDPDGSYVRRWVPELAGLPDDWLHRPSEAPEAVLRKAGIELGASSYPKPILDHGIERARSLAAFKQLRGSG